jgi:hypothetical protein
VGIETGLSELLARVISLDHSAEKALGKNWKKAIDADNLVVEFHDPNS